METLGFLVLCSVMFSHCAQGHACGGYLSGSGSLSSPGYPGSYPHGAYCVWQLTASPNHRIFLSFTDFQLENCCACDYVSVFDGPSVNSRLLGKLCEKNDTVQDFFQSSSTQITVLFRTDGSVSGRGFNANFTSSLTSGSGRVECSGHNMDITIEKSYLNSMGYAGNNLYLNDPYCRPRITAYQVIFSFPINTCGTIRTLNNGSIAYTNSLRAHKSDYGLITRQSSLKLNVDCRMEPDTTVQIVYVARAQVGGLIMGMGRFNGSMAFYTSGNFVNEVTQVPSLVLFLDTCVASPSPHDFHNISYDLVRNGCVKDDSYYAYASGYNSYARFTFRAFQFLRTHESVYLQCKVVICPASDYNSRCRRGCSVRKARALRAAEDSHTLVLGPITLHDPQGQGHACGGYLSGSGSLSSLGYPGYPPGAYCVWQLTASPNHTIFLSFTDFQLEDCCGCDYVSVFDGPSVNSRLLGKLCENNHMVQDSFQSSSTQITVLFRTDGSVSGRGFNANFTSSLPSGSAQPSCRYNCGRDNGNCSCSSSCEYFGNCCYDYYWHACGGYLSGSGSLSSPGYPGSYPPDVYCVWQLTALPNHTILLSLTDFQLKDCCSCDYVSVFDGPSVNSQLLGKLCGTYNTVQDFLQSSSTQITVLFWAGGSGSGRGFNANFTSSLPSGS
ncbi:hypothetical protein NHX12_022029, partial [Muraenolepis orangiensis]